MKAAPLQGSHTGGIIIAPVGWFFPFLLHIACGVHPQNISGKRVLFFSLLHQLALYFPFHFSIVFTQNNARAEIS